MTSPQRERLAELAKLAACSASPEVLADNQIVSSETASTQFFSPIFYAVTDHIPIVKICAYEE